MGETVGFGVNRKARISFPFNGLICLHEFFRQCLANSNFADIVCKIWLAGFASSLFIGRWTALARFQSRGLGHIGAEMRAELGYVVGEKRSLVAGAGDGDVAKARIEQVRVCTENKNAPSPGRSKVAH